MQHLGRSKGKGEHCDVVFLASALGGLGDGFGGLGRDGGGAVEAKELASGAASFGDAIGEEGQRVARGKVKFGSRVFGRRGLLRRRARSSSLCRRIPTEGAPRGRLTVTARHRSSGTDASIALNRYTHQHRNRGRIPGHVPPAKRRDMSKRQIPEWRDDTAGAPIMEARGHKCSNFQLWCLMPRFFSACSPKNWPERFSDQQGERPCLRSLLQCCNPA